MRTGEPHDLTEIMNEEQPWLRLMVMDDAVDLDRDRTLHRLTPSAGYVPDRYLVSSG
jgi:hypothetical protein